MGYLGTPIDTTNQFQSLQGKRFNGDNSTTDFTLDVAPGSTLDIEVFVGNVRQDPNSAYTVSGTTLSFTGAPPTGTNNIYVVHQAKAVGTITPPDDSVGANQLADNSVGITQLNVSDGTNGQALTTNGSGTLAFSTISGTTINNNADNRVITGSGTANTLEGEANLTFDGNTLTANKVILTNSSGLTGGASSDGFITNADDTDTGIVFPDSDRIQFWTGDVERMRIGADGRVAIGVTSTGAGGFSIRKDLTGANIAYFDNTSSSNAYGPFFDFANVSHDDNDKYFLTCEDSTAVRLRIWSDGDIVNHDNSYGAISDVKLKEQIVDASSQWNDIKNLRVRKFKLKEDVSNKGDSDSLWRIGLVAQEAETVSPNLVSTDPDKSRNSETGEIENLGTETKRIKYSILYMKAVKALQEAMDRIETLEAENTDIKARLTALEG